MANPQHLKISGMLNQHEFKERYLFTLQRINNGFSRQEMAFLLGRTSYDVTDYEQLGAHIKMGYADHEVMAAVFRKPAPAAPLFQSKLNAVDISNDKRMIRGNVLERHNQRFFDFVHPWYIKGEIRPIGFTEDLSRDGTQDNLINEFVCKQLFLFKNAGCFDRGCTGFFLYQQLKPLLEQAWKPLFLKNLRVMIYAMIHAQELCTLQFEGRVYYKTKSSAKN